MLRFYPCVGFWYYTWWCTYELLTWLFFGDACYIYIYILCYFWEILICMFVNFGDVMSISWIFVLFAFYRFNRSRALHFPNIIVTPMGGDKVFIICNDGAGVWQLIHGVHEFFGILLWNFQKWTSNEVRYERGAWLRVGRFIQVDECTVDKARLDYAHILVSTTNIDIVNQSVEFIIDDNKFLFKVVEEWGCNLGDDAFMTEVEPEPTPEEFFSIKKRRWIGWGSRGMGVGWFGERLA